MRALLPPVFILVRWMAGLSLFQFIFVLLLATANDARATSKVDDGGPPVALNVVLIGFHQPESGWISDYDLERVLTGTIATKSISLGEGPFKRLKKVVTTYQNDIPSDAVGLELESLADNLGLLNQGFTLFILNLKRPGDDLPTGYAYCQSRFIEMEDRILRTAEEGIRDTDRGETWAKKQSPSYPKSECRPNDPCRVNAWITNNRVGWIDLTASRAPWGNKYGLSLPMPPTHSLTLQFQQERAQHIKKTALTEKHCKECKTFLQAWASLLDRASQETDFSRAYDTVARASEALESIISQEFAITTSHDLEDDMVSELEIQSQDRKLSTGTSSDFLAHLSLVIRSFANRVLLPFNAEAIHTASLYGFDDDEERNSMDGSEDPTSRVTVHLYLVRGHDDDQDLGPSDEDVARMREELGRLAIAPFQTFSMVVHRLDLDHDPVLGAAFAFSLHSMVVPTIVDGRQVGKTRHYVNAREFRQVLLAENDRAHLAFSSSSGKSRSAHHTELPVFWFYGVDSSNEPLYVDGYHRAIHLKDLVVVVESKHTSVERLDAWCGASRIKVSVARPLRAAVITTAQLWWSENLGPDAAERYIDESVADWSWAVGVGDARGLSLFEEREEELGAELLSNVLVDAFHRSTLLEALRRIKKVVDKAKRIGERGGSRFIAEHADKIVRIKAEVVRCSRMNDWQCAFTNLVTCRRETDFLSQELAKAQSRKIVPKGSSCNGGTSSSRSSRPGQLSTQGDWGWVSSLWR